MNERFAAVLNLNKFLTIDPNKQKMKCSIENLFNKRDQARRFPWIWSHSLNKSSMEN